MRKSTLVAATLLGSFLILSGVSCSAPKASRPAPPEQPAGHGDVMPPTEEPRQRTEASIAPPPPPPHPVARASHAAPPPPPPPPTDDQIIESEVAHLRKGNLAYSTPQKMKTGQSARVAASIGSDEVSMQALQSSLPKESGQVAQTAGTPVSTKMKMTLKSADFDITDLSSEEQIVAGNTPTTWEWDITPRHSGQLRLHLAAVVELKDISRDFTTVDRDIAVQVDPIDAARKFASGNWQWILTTLGAGLVAAWKFLSKRKKPQTQT